MSKTVGEPPLKTPFLQKLFHPQSIAVIGASQKSGKVGFTVLQNLVDAGFGGDLFAVNPKYDSINSIPCVSTITEIEQQVDLAIICTPAQTVAAVVRECGQANVGGIIVLTAGFEESGQTGRQLQVELKEIAESFPSMRLIGPNCVGVINSASKLNASFARGMPKPGRISFVSQSGALCTSVLDWALQENIGFANVVSIGNMVDVGWGELIDYFANDSDTDALVLYIESVKDAAQFMKAAAACSRSKPIVAYKAGRFSQSAAAAASHTGALAAEDVVYETVFRRIGMQRVFSVEEMFDTAELFARVGHENSPIDPGRPDSIAGNDSNQRAYRQALKRLAIVSNAGGPAVMATDTLIELKGTLAKLADQTIAALDDVLPVNWSKQNPVDVIGDAPPQRLAAATDIVLKDTGVDAVLVIVSPQAMTQPDDCAQAIVKVAGRSDKPILACWMGGVSMEKSVESLNNGGLATYPTPERAVKAFTNLVNYQAIAASSGERSLDDLQAKPEPREKKEIGSLPTETDAKDLLLRYQIDVVPTRLAKSNVDAVRLARDYGFPVALKIASPEISHKSDFGGVQLNLRNEQEVKDGYRKIIAAVREHHPQEIIMGVSVQPMIDVSQGYELIAGLKRDPVFGPVVMVGAGGVNAEVFKDVAFDIPPLDRELATAMIKSLRSWPILSGFRGQPVLNTRAVADALVNLAQIALDYPEIKELDINPLLVTPDRAVALDARIIMTPHAGAS